MPYFLLEQPVVHRLLVYCAKEDLEALKSVAEVLPFTRWLQVDPERPLEPLAPLTIRQVEPEPEDNAVKIMQILRIRDKATGTVQVAVMTSYVDVDTDDVVLSTSQLAALLREAVESGTAEDLSPSLAEEDDLSE